MKTTLELQLNVLKEMLGLQACLIAQSATRTLETLASDDGLRIHQNDLAGVQSRIHAEFLLINEFCSTVLCLHAPKASDLRFVLGALRINEALHRLAVNHFSIARKAPATADFTAMTVIIYEMIETMLQSVLELDIEAARSMLRDQQTVLSCKHELSRRLTEYVKSGAFTPTRFSDLITILRKLKQMTSVLVEISECVLYIRAGGFSDGEVASVNSACFCPDTLRVS